MNGKHNERVEPYEADFYQVEPEVIVDDLAIQLADLYNYFMERTGDDTDASLALLELWLAEEA